MQEAATPELFYSIRGERGSYNHLDTFAKVGEADEVQGVCNTGFYTYQ